MARGSSVDLRRGRSCGGGSDAADIEELTTDAWRAVTDLIELMSKANRGQLSIFSFRAAFGFFSD